MKNILGITALILLVWCQQASAQSVGINTSNPHPSAVLDVYSEDRGILIPRMTTTRRLSIINPARSLMVFDTDENAFYYFDGTVWQAFNSTDDDLWKEGNGYIYNDESLVGIGIDSALALLHLHSDTTSPYMLITNNYYNVIIGLDETDGTIFMGRDSSGFIKKQLVVDTVGRVGIGKNTPQEVLHMAVDTGDAAIKMETPLYNVIIGLDETDGTITVGSDSAGTRNPHLQIDTAGRVGIGSLDNTAQLNVDGRVKTNQLELHSANGDNYVIELDDQGLPDVSKSTNNYLDLYNSVAATFTNTLVDIPWDQQRWAPPVNSAYAHSATTSNSEITIERTGLYKITYTLSYEGTLLFDAEVETVLQIKPAAGVFAYMPGSTTYSSIGLNLSSNRSSVTKTIIAPLNQDDVLKLSAKRSAGGGTISTLPNGCSITIERL